MAGNAEIWDALLAHMQQLTLEPPLEVAWPGVRYEPSRDAGGRVVPYIRTDVLPSSSPSSILQLSVVWPADDGVIAAVRVADRVAAHFALGTVLATSAAQRVRVSRDPWVSPPLVGDGEIVVPLRVLWTAYSPKPGG